MVHQYVCPRFDSIFWYSRLVVNPKRGRYVMIAGDQISTVLMDELRDINDVPEIIPLVCWSSSLCYLCALCTRFSWETNCACINSLWCIGAIWRHRSWSALAQVIAWCLTAPSHSLNLCWLSISEVLWHSPTWQQFHKKCTSTQSATCVRRFLTHLLEGNELKCLWYEFPFGDYQRVVHRNL